MALQKADREAIVKKYRKHDKDTASPQVQIALLSARLVYLNDHFKDNSKDHHSRRGLMKLVGQRRRLLDYLAHTDKEGYASLVKSLGIRG
jgi:small subunit ribosomal protein S15